jgi:predicted RNA-binding Zn-ribbon protein involved in translation (DUF1610 family)
MNKEQIDHEIFLIQQDKHRPNVRKNNMQFIRLMALLIPLLGMALTLSAKPIGYHAYAITDDGVSFRCTKCGQKQWQSKKNRDWQGNYYCNKCGQKA